jgi:uncharacterized SAM-binding protein YcdF (DUF218 family)
MARQSRFFLKWLRIAGLILPPVLISGWIATVIIWIDAFGSRNWLSTRKVDAIVVLGAGVDYDRPSPVYEARLRHAVDLHRSGVAPTLVFTGGTGIGDRLSEGEVGRDYALAHGVPSSAVLFEDTSHTTFQNLREARKELDRTASGRTIALVSDPHHLFRASLMASQSGLNPWPSGTPFTRFRSLSSRLPALLREAYFLHHYALFGQ